MLIVHHTIHMNFAKEKEFRIRPHSDIQWGHRDVDMDLVNKMISETAKDDMCISLGCGDVIDSDRPSMRMKKIVAFAGRDDEIDQDDMKKMDIDSPNMSDAKMMSLWNPPVEIVKEAVTPLPTASRW